MIRGLTALFGFLWRRKFKVMTAVFAPAFIILAGVTHYGITMSDIPLWAWVALATAAITFPYAVFVSAVVVGLIYDPDRVILAEVDGGDGDLAVHDISPQTWEELIAVDANGNEISRAFLHRIDVRRASEAYEVHQYNPDTNVAEVSWMGDVTEREIRRHENLLEQVRESLSPLARAYEEMHARVDIEIEERTSDAMNSMLAMVEGVELPPGESMHEQMAGDAGREQLNELPDPDEALDDIDAPSPEEIERGEADLSEVPDRGGDEA